MKLPFTMKDLAVAQASATALLFLSIPVFNLMGFGSNKLMAVLHGLGATLTVILSGYTMHQTYPLMRGKKETARSLELMLWLTNILVLLTIVFGNWLYIAYRAPDGLQQWFLYHQPAIHTVAMEFKEFVSLLPLPLGIAAAVLLRRFRFDLEQEPAIAGVIAMLVTLSFITLLIGFAIGLGMAKLRMI